MIEQFRSLSLDELNSKAAMLERRDNKYVVTRGILTRFLADVGNSFDILDIDGIRQFAYETVYFDGLEHECYRHHHQGRRRRCKVRIRKYQDAGLTYLEVKLKDKRGQTLKRRIRTDDEIAPALSDQQRCFVGYCYRELYGDQLDIAFNRVLDITYRRSTLVAREGGERMTIDCQLGFSNGGTTVTLDEDLIIVEAKSGNGNGMADKLLRRLHQHPANRCSKYCTGLAIMQPGLPCNMFRSTLAKLGVRR